MRPASLFLALPLVVAGGCGPSEPGELPGTTNDPGEGASPGSGGDPMRPAVISRAEGPAFDSAPGEGVVVARLGGKGFTSTEISSLLLKRDPELFHQILNEIIVRFLSEEEAEGQGVRFTDAEHERYLERAVDAEVEAARQHVQVQYQMTLEELLREEKDDFASFRGRIADRLRPEIGTKIRIERLARHWSLSTECVEASRIVVAERAKAEDLLAKIREGASVSRLAEEHSIDPFRKRGGKLPRIYRGQLPAKTEAMLFSMQAGGVTGVIEEEGRYAIFVVTSVQAKRLVPYADMRDEVSASIEERPVEQGEIEGWYQEAIRSHGLLERYYDLPRDEVP